jgi:hypothetical protein
MHGPKPAGGRLAIQGRRQVHAVKASAPGPGQDVEVEIKPTGVVNKATPEFTVVKHKTSMTAKRQLSSHSIIGKSTRAKEYFDR